jgi:hypothetical protein
VRGLYPVELHRGHARIDLTRFAPCHLDRPRGLSGEPDQSRADRLLRFARVVVGLPGVKGRPRPGRQGHEQPQVVGVARLDHRGAVVHPASEPGATA